MQNNEIELISNSNFKNRFKMDQKVRYKTL